ncbi:hypothetical protein [Nonomuraea sp. NPDC023979]|uniref:hypothetical protein n=1 Tax=Nonomuraea sp. NPDC023979 TaxID=3154796 RepID=UPI0033C45BBD
MTKLVFLDTETTSLDDERGEVWEIGAIVRRPDHDNVVGDVEYLWQTWPGLSIADPNSLRIGRFYERNWLARGSADSDAAIEIPISEGEIQQPDLPMDYRTKQQVARDLAVLLDGAHVVGAVPDFDYRFLRRFLATHGHRWTAHYHLIDIEAMAVGWLHGKAAQLAVREPDIDWRGMAAETAGLPWKSTDLYRALKVDPDRFEAHTALGDARLVKAVYDAITGGA